MAETAVDDGSTQAEPDHASVDTTAPPTPQPDPPKAPITASALDSLMARLSQAEGKLAQMEGHAEYVTKAEFEAARGDIEEIKKTLHEASRQPIVEPPPPPIEPPEDTDGREPVGSAQGTIEEPKSWKPKVKVF